MNCYKHHDVAAIATCSNGCGRGLCPECADKYAKPLCENCAMKLESEISRQVSTHRAKLVFKMIVNVLFLIPYIILITQQNETPDWVMIPMLIWGFIAFRWILNALLDLSNITLTLRIKTWSITYVIGSLVCGGLGLGIIPILLIIELVQFLKA